MSKIPTAEEFLTISDEFEVLETKKQEEVVTKAMIEFAKLHVEAALKEAKNLLNPNCKNVYNFIKLNSH